MRAVKTGKDSQGIPLNLLIFTRQMSLENYVVMVLNIVYTEDFFGSTGTIMDKRGL